MKFLRYDADHQQLLFSVDVDKVDDPKQLLELACEQLGLQLLKYEHGADRAFALVDFEGCNLEWHFEHYSEVMWLHSDTEEGADNLNFLANWQQRI
ncbi:DUF3630 family protein [Paraferrimonas sp. SM1919]|uniref:DUF3630 family protein n=1 Tax=Paraferrimonas sp. SM1919 TaxID=2662263 RepID=UPI0013D4E71B|nr:DUF3630 family protein [Paraferrimonas sp. SM1919]